MANKKVKKAAEPKEVARFDLGNGMTLVKFDDGTYSLIITGINGESLESAFASESSEDDDEDEDEDEDEDDDEEVTPESLAEMDFEELEDLCDDKELETSPDDYDEKDIEKLRTAIAKELGIKLPKKAAPAKGKKGKK